MRRRYEPFHYSFLGKEKRVFNICLHGLNSDTGGPSLVASIRTVHNRFPRQLESTLEDISNPPCCNVTLLFRTFPKVEMLWTDKQ